METYSWVFVFVIICTVTNIIYHSSVKHFEERRPYPTARPRIKFPTINFTKYKEIFPKYSPYFGLSYLNVYGRPRSDFLDKGFEQELEEWRVYFPELMTSLKKFNQLRKQNTNFTLNTFSNSRVVIVDKRTKYKTGDILNARIDAYNWKENKRSFGGDYFVARLVYGNGLYPDGIAGIVTDHRNGTYSIRVPLLIPGEARLEVKLMIPLEGIAELIRCTSLRKFLGTTYVGTFETLESTECNIDLSFTKYSLFYALFLFTFRLTEDKICDYSNPRNQEPWFCVKPPSGKCSKIIKLTFDRNEPSVYDSTNEICNENLLQQLGSSKLIYGSGLKISIQRPGFQSQQLPKLPVCKTSLNGITTKRPNGYFVNGLWKSTFCKNNLKSLAEAGPCFHNKDIYFLGDSTSRQYYYLFAKMIGMEPVYREDGTEISLGDGWNQPRTFQSGSTQMYFRGHGTPMQNSGHIAAMPYVSDMLDEIASRENEVVVIFNLGLHVLYFEPSFFIHRMRGIKDAMLRLNQRRANVRVIFRSQRVLDINTNRTNGWLAYRYGVLTREIFKDVKNLFYFDLWDLSSVWPLNHFHPRQEHLEQEALYLCNFICNGIRV
ncbi:NXPE family member 1-like [Ciona intestinalis]